MIRDLWPVNPAARRIDKLALRSGHLPGYCNVCGSATVFTVRDPNLRDTVNCRKCGSSNRQRQIAAVLLSTVSPRGSSARFADLGDLPQDTVVWIAETTTALKEYLARRLGPNCIASEYLSPSLASGETRDGILHVDMQQTHFEEDTLDVIVSCDVLEHIPSVSKVLRETYRVLKPGGFHVFTAPFYLHRFTNEQRSVLDERGELRHLRRPWYHGDPLRSEGALVFNVFAPELLCLLEDAGFAAKLCLVSSPLHGILGNNGIVIVARKAPRPDSVTDDIFPSDPWTSDDPG
jgi:SAM-dependent methyltransferase